MHSIKALALFASTILAVAFVACGSDESDDSGSGTPTISEAEHTDGAFISQMIPHHEGAIEMAEVAQEQAEHPEVRRMAEEVIATQSEEVRELEAAHERLFGEPVGGVEHGAMGLSTEDAGMGHDSSALEGADPFDQAFIDMMIPHHQGAIRMARIQLERGQDEELNALAEEIIDAQGVEIEQMNDWREQWYGEPSPSGGMPGMGKAPSHDEMGH
jgi:uncharacterized protein (DUF305 family)